MNLKKYIGTRSFYKTVMLIAIPIMLQQGLTTFVNLLDNVMVGRLGTEEMSGVAITNQLLFVYNLCVFGSLSGASIFLAQFFGAKDDKGIQSSFRFKLISAFIVFILATIIFILFGKNLISFFLNEAGEEVGDIEKVLFHGHQYLLVMLFGLFPFAISQVYGSTLRETKEAITPMVAGIVAILVNLVFNYILIFGHFGFPALGIKGAAIATVLSRYVEMIILVLYIHIRSDKFSYIKGIYRSFTIPKNLITRITLKSLPLLLNELLWSVGRTVIVQSFSVRGLMVIASYNISSTVSNIFFVGFQAMGRAVAIIVGQYLGAKEYEEAKDTRIKMFAFSVFVCFILGLVLIGVSFVTPDLYKTTDSVKQLATKLMIVTGICLPLFAYNASCYFTLSAGGVTTATFLFDSVFVWTVSIPLAFVLSKHTNIDIVIVYFIVQIGDIIKTIIGYFLMKKEVWVRNIVLE